MPYDIALTEVSGTITLHYAYCSQARMMALLGFPVATLLECEQLPEESYPAHSCMDRYRQGPVERPPSDSFTNTATA
jgi:hypothetical protein